MVSFVPALSQLHDILKGKIVNIVNKNQNVAITIHKTQNPSKMYDF